MPAYTSAILKEMELLNTHFSAPSINTVYFGGGTPSHLPLPEIKKMCKGIEKNFTLSSNLEMTIEANPGTLQPVDLDELFALGFNRLSLGAQSVHMNELSLFGRIHTHGDTVKSVLHAQKSGFTNISLDLIFGAPTQTRASFMHSLNEIIRLHPAHISLYALSLEEGTLLTHMVREGVVNELSGSMTADMYSDAIAVCLQAGYRHYEISNWGVPGYESRHNTHYWRAGEYYGVGPSAHSYHSGRRSWHAPSVRRYIEKMSAADSLEDTSWIDGFEEISTEDAMSEMMILGLRLLDEGVSDDVFIKRFGRSFTEVFGPQIERLCARKLLTQKDGVLYLNHQAAFISNQVFSEFISNE